VIGTGEHTYEVFHDWGELPSQISYGNTHGVVQDSHGRIYIAHTVHAGSASHDSLVVFDEKGKFIRSWGSEFEGGAHGLHVAKEGSDEFLYLVDTGKGRSPNVDPSHTWMVKMTLRGEEVFRIGYPRESSFYKVDAKGQPLTKFSPTNIAIAPNGDLYVADGYGSSTISQYTSRGKYIRTFGEPGKGPGQMEKPHGLIVDTRGSTPVLLVADRSNNRLQTFTLDGKHISFGGGVNRPCHFAERNGVLLIPDLAARVTLMDRENRVIAHLGEDTSGTWEELRKQTRDHFVPGKFVSPHGACFDHDGNIFVAEWVEVGRVTKLRKVA
jgi:DNA-binding beta-propeller fold protein YncE